MATQRYLVTARKYRPQRFEELVAQEHVTETLKNAVRFDRLAHAYLFSGPRGVGKTTAARILAKAINCTTPLEQRGGAEPCRECDSCRTFEEGRSLNIIEIDAASNNKVDDVRDLRETVRIPPQGARKKVYIVDEVHMLSTAAFNALLKTLEEPPPHVLFIFATTEPHKVLPTILSRCQRFDFRRIAVPEIVARLRGISREENITADEASLMLLARKGDGALRDALSVFDQAVSLCGTDLRYAELAQALGVVDVDLYFDVTNFVANRDAAGMLRLVDGIVRSGYDLQEFLAGLAEHLRNLLVALAMTDTSLIEAAENTRERYATASAAFTEADLLRLLTLVSDTEEAIKNSPQPRLRLETALLKMASISLAADLREAIEKIERLEKMAREGTIPPDLGGGGAAALESPSSAPASPREESPSAGLASTSRGSSSSSAAPSSSVHEPSPQRDFAPSVKSETSLPGSKASSAEASLPGSAASSAASESSHPNSSATSAPPHGSGPDPQKSGASDHASAEASLTRDPIPQPEPTSGLFGTPALKRRNSPPAFAPAAAEGDDGSDVIVAEENNVAPLLHVWDDLVTRVTEDRIHVGSLLKHSRPEDLSGDTAVVAVPDDFHQRLLTHQQDYLVAQINPLIKEPIRSMHFVIRDDLDAPTTGETASDFDPYEYMKRKRQENPVIRAIFDQFGGELVW